MCRFVLYHGPDVRLSSLITEPVNSIIHQSFQSRERAEPLNGDGFGVAWYVPGEAEPVQFRSITPAWSNQNLRHLAAKLKSPTVLAHVRAASPGLAVAETNTHPFCWKRLSFMHNGHIAGFRAIRRRFVDALEEEPFEMIQGTTDSEYLFALLVQHFRHDEAGDPADRLARALTAAIRESLKLVRHAGVTAPSFLNVAVSDGRAAVVSRFTTDAPHRAESLHVHTGRAYVCEDGVTHMVELRRGGHAVIVSSEALSDDPGWDTVPPNHLVLVREDRSVEFQPLAA
jgi:glutamine amidotransferase